MQLKTFTVLISLIASLFSGWFLGELVLGQVARPDGTVVSVPSCLSTERLSYNGSTFSCVTTEGGGSGGPHTHPIPEVVDLGTQLLGKASSTHNHDGQYSALGHTHIEYAATVHTHNYSPIGHNHAISEVTNLQSSLDLKSNTDHTHAGGGSATPWTIPVQALSFAPADSVFTYFGTNPTTPSSTAAQRKVHIRKAGTITVANIYGFGGAGTAEAWSLHIRVNNTTDYLISTQSVATAERVWSNTSLNISIVNGDYFEIKSTQPLWATNPTAYTMGGYVIVQ